MDREHEGGAAALDSAGGKTVGVDRVIRGREGEFWVLIVCHGFISIIEGLVAVL
jgi:hypothetical protein